MILQNIPIISLLLLFPLVGAIICLAPIFSKQSDPCNKICRLWSITIATLNLAFTLVLARFINPTTLLSESNKDLLKLTEVHAWINTLGIKLSFTFDGVSFALCFLTTLVTLLILIWTDPKESIGKGWYAMLLFAESSVLGAFLATDLILFYVFYELMLIPILFGMIVWGEKGSVQAALKFLLYTISSSVLMFVGIIYCALRVQETTGIFSTNLKDIIDLQLFNSTEQIVLGAVFLLAFAAKIPIVPLHSWLPGVYTQSSYALSAFIAALLGKVGLYGIIRFIWPMFPLFFQEYGELLAALGAIGVVYASLLALIQTDIRLLLAYSSVAHLAFCVLGLSSPSILSITGAIFQSVSHGLITAALFLGFGKVAESYQKINVKYFHGLAHQSPKLAFFLMIFSFAAVALPLTSSFVGELLILLGTYRQFPLWCMIALSAVVLGAVYTLSAYIKIFFGKTDKEAISLPELKLNCSGRLVLSILSTLVVVLGIYPRLLLLLIEPAVSEITQQVVAN